MVSEHDRGGFQLELGMVLVLHEYLDQTYLLKRSYPADIECQKYNWMLEAGVFDRFDYEERLREWETEDELQTEIDDLLDDILERT